MPVIETVDRRRSPRFLSALAIALGLTLFPACSSDSDGSADTDSATTVAAATDGVDDAADGDRSGATDTTGLPAGFPDVPLPEFTKVDVIKAETETAPGWNVMFTVDETLATPGDDIVNAYVEQLEAAGYEVEGDTSDVTIEATRDGTAIHFHSSMDGTITIGVMPS